MLLPCPHCKRRFKLSTDRIPAGATKLRCPACKGHFVVDTSPLRRVPVPTPRPVSPQPAPDSAPGKTPPPAATNTEEPRDGPLRKHRPMATLWLLLPVAGLLVALMGVLVPAVWKTPTASVEQTAQGGPSAPCALPSPISDQASEAVPADTSVKQAKQEDPQPAQAKHPLTYRSMWPFSPVGKQKSCEYLAQLEGEGRRKNAAGPGSFYAAWIAYLSLETSSSPACKPEPAFRIATEATHSFPPTTRTRGSSADPGRSSRRRSWPPRRIPG